LKLGTVVDLDSMSKSVDFGFKRSGLELGLGLGFMIASEVTTV